MSDAIDFSHPSPLRVTPLRTAVIGTGALGLGLGSALVAAGARVHFVSRSAAAADALRRNGFRRSGLLGPVVAPPHSITASANFDSLRKLPLDAVLVCTKSTACETVAGALETVWKNLPGAPPIVVACQNGWGSAEHFAATLPRDRVYNASVITGFRRTPAGPTSKQDCVEITAHAHAIRMGSLFGAPERAVEPLCDAIRRGGIPCESSPDVARDVWAKMLYNCALNPLGAILGLRYGQLADRRESRAIIASVITEIFEVMACKGFETHWREPEAYLDHLWQVLLPATARHESSMLLDLRAQRPTEIDVLSGAVVRLASEHGLPVPVNTALATLVHAIEAEVSDP